MLYSKCFVIRSQEWNKIIKSDREKIGLTFDDDGEFWFVFFISRFYEWQSVLLCGMPSAIVLFMQALTWKRKYNTVANQLKVE